MANKSKIVVVWYPRKKKLTKEQMSLQSVITGDMALMSVGGVIKPDSKLVFELRDGPTSKGLPRGWFSGDSQFNIEGKRVMSPEGYNTLYHWAKGAGVPVFSGEFLGEPSLMVIGPYWADEIDELFARAIPLKQDIRPISPVGSDVQIEEK